VHAGSQSASAPATGPDGALFKAQLGDSIVARTATNGTVTASNSSPAPSATVALARAVKAKLDAGSSLSDIITQLASSLATSVATQLGISPQAAQARLTQAFSQALQPTDTGPPGSNAERASTLATRFRQIAELATRVTNGDQGQPIRSIAGNSSDAETAKANPAPNPDSILKDALQALAGTPSPATGTATAVTTAAAAAVATATAAASDGRTVAISPLDAIAAGGDTPLGRMLTRATLSDPTRTTPVAAPIMGPSHGLGGTQTGGNPAQMPIAVIGSADPVDAFLSAFTGALTRGDEAGMQRHAADLADIAPVDPTQTATASAQPIASFALPTAHDAVAIAPPTPPALPQAQHVDANAVVDQMLRGLSIRTTDGQSEVRLRLVPEQLGDVSIKLTVSGGSVDASITAHTVDAQNALAGAQPQLAKSLADAGLKLQSFSVGLAGGDFADPRDQSRSDDRSTKPALRRIGAVDAVDADTAPESSLLAVPSFGPPIYAANPALGALNYLV
jgi:hypothetical protein